MDIFERLGLVEHSIMSRMDGKEPKLLKLPQNAGIFELLSDIAGGATYGAMPAQLIERSKAILKEYGPETSRDFARLLLVRAIRAWLTTKHPFESNGLIRAVYEREVDRLVTSIETRNEAYEFDFASNVYTKDLQCFTGRMVPCGAQVVDLQSGMPRRLILSDRVGNLPGNLLFALRMGGFAPYCEIHTHTPTLSDFHEDGWDKCYLCIAEIFRANPSLKGMIGSSWFYDPALESISPNLAYLRHRPLANGARLFRIGQIPASKRDALATSKTRNKLYEEGKYSPTHYALVWPRDDLIKWAESAT